MGQPFTPLGLWAYSEIREAVAKIEFAQSIIKPEIFSVGSIHLDKALEQVPKTVRSRDTFESASPLGPDVLLSVALSCFGSNWSNASLREDSR